MVSTIIKNSVVHTSGFSVLGSCSRFGSRFAVHGAVRGSRFGSRFEVRRSRFTVRGSQFAVRDTVEPEHEPSTEKAEV
jgi:hypothetical protein